MSIEGCDKQEFKSFTAGTFKKCLDSATWSIIVDLFPYMLFITWCFIGYICFLIVLLSSLVLEDMYMVKLIYKQAT